MQYLRSLIYTVLFFLVTAFFATVVILLMWFYLSAYVVLLGAELNAEMEHQTARDTTERMGAPLGARGAYMADTVGASQ